MKIESFISAEANAVSILFFGRYGDRYSQQCLSHLKDLGFTVHVIWSQSIGEKIPEETYSIQCDYILCFRSYFILDTRMLKLPRYFAINFHPGPSNYPGSGCANYAMYNGEDNYGVTAHIMEKGVDTGDILDVVEFPILESYNSLDLLETTYKKGLEQFMNFTSQLAAVGADFIRSRREQMSGVKWSGTYRKIKDLEAFKKIDPNITPNDLERMIRCCNHPEYPIYIEVHGKKFYLKNQ